MQLRLSETSGISITRSRVFFFNDCNEVEIDGLDLEIMAKIIVPALLVGVSIDILYSRLGAYSKQDIENLLKRLLGSGVISLSANMQISGKLPCLYTKMLDDREEIIGEMVVNPRKLTNFKYPFCIVSCKYKKPNCVATEYPETNWATGADIDPAIAIDKAIGEAVERYASGSYEVDDMLLTSYAQLGELAVDPRLILDCRPLVPMPFYTKKKYRWVKATDIKNGCDKYVLADCVYYPTTDGRLGKNRFTYLATSSGIAAYYDINTAIEKGIKELIERDAFMITWINKTPKNVLIHSSLPKGIQDQIISLEERNFKVFIVDITIDFLPIYVCVLFGNVEGYASFFGAGCDEDPENAIHKAITEAESLLYFADVYDYKTIEEKQIITPLDHSRFFRSLVNIPRIKWYVQGSCVKFHRKHRQNLWQLLRNECIYVCDLTNRHILEAYGLKVCRTIMPRLVPITFGYMQLAIGTKRLREFGLQLCGRLPDELLTHPFA